LIHKYTGLNITKHQTI